MKENFGNDQLTFLSPKEQRQYTEGFKRPNK